MKATKSVPVAEKSPSGIPGLDEMTGGGLPCSRTTLIAGGPGSGKSLLALQFLVNGARRFHEAGIFVAFEESSERIMANAGKFGWDLRALQRENLFFLDAQPTPDLIQSGSFDLGGMLTVLDAKVRAMKAKRIVFDAIDIVLALFKDPGVERGEIYKLHEWLLARGLTAIITAKAGEEAAMRQQLSFMQFMVDCALTLNHDMVQGVSQRNLRILKYRGSGFEENETPFVIGNDGLEVAGTRVMGRSETRVSKERVSSGVARLDTMLGGGYFRGASILITGFPGTAKSTLAGAFAEAACQRGEPTLLVSFDSGAGEVIRNLASVGIRLQRFVKSVRLHILSGQTIAGSGELHFMRLKNLAREHGVRCVVIDPVSALAKSGNLPTAHSVAERLVDWAKAEQMTLLCTSLLDEAGPLMEGTPLQISTIADTWIHLNYMVHAGERNRGLSIIKSRGTEHSNQVRELILGRRGITLADVFTAGGEVLMGTLRWEKEQSKIAAQSEAEQVARQRLERIGCEQADLAARIKGLERELETKRNEEKSLTRMMAGTAAEASHGRTRVRELRRADASVGKQK